jgi:cell division septal protein FtsQ
MSRRTARKPQTAGRRRAAAVKLLMGFGVTVLIAVAGWMGTARAWEAVTGRPEFRLDLRELTLNDCPGWVNCERMREELLGQLRSLPQGASVLDRRIASAAHERLGRSAWLLGVLEVSRALPNRLLVTAVYRKPAGVVEWRGGYHLVDQDGHHLPDGIFLQPAEWEGGPSPVIVDRLLRGGPPTGREWDAPRIAVGARLTDFLRREGLLAQLNVVSIDVTGVARHTVEPEITLVTAGGTVVKWGRSSVYNEIGALRSPAAITPDSEKLAMLRSKIVERPGLQGIASLDLRFHGKIILIEQEARPQPVR